MHHRNKCLLILIVAGFVSAYKQCMMPDRRTGKCRPINECSPILDLRNKRNKTSSDLQYLFQTSASCNTEPLLEVMVCCPPERLWVELKTFNSIVYNDTMGDDIREPNGIGIEHRFSVPMWNQYECGRENSNLDNRILGGNVADDDQFPWLVLMENEKHVKPCGGSLISTRYVLTAAHCIKREKLKYARLGEYNITSSENGFVIDGRVEVDRVPIVENIAHPNYTRTYHHHDIGLSKLSRDAVLSDFVRLICLPDRDLVQSFREPIDFTVAGWGRDEYGHRGIKRYVKVGFVPLDRCRPLYHSIIDSQICAGGIRNKDSCKGDSGGPLMYERQNTFVLLGIVSYGPTRCGMKNVPSIYTYVYSYSDWLRENMV